MVVGLQSEGLAVPVTHLAAGTFNDRDMSKVIMGLHIGFYNYIEIAIGKQTVGDAIATPDNELTFFPPAGDKIKALILEHHRRG